MYCMKTYLFSEETIKINKIKLSFPLRHFDKEI